MTHEPRASNLRIIRARGGAVLADEMEKIGVCHGSEQVRDRMYTSDGADWFRLCDENAQTEAEQFAARWDDSDYTLILGMGLGYHIRALHRRVAQQQTKKRFHVFEPSPVVFSAALETLDLSDVFSDDRWSWHIGANSATARIFQPTLKPFTVLMMPFRNGGYARKQFALVSHAIEDEWNSVNSLIGTARALSVTFFRNSISNLASWRFPGPWGDAWKRKPVIIAGSGPSLEDFTDSGIPVIACDGALPALRMKGIEPALLCTIDPISDKRSVFEDFKGAVAAIDSADHETIRGLDTHMFWSAAWAAIVPKYLDAAAVMTTTTVSHLAFHVACLLGADPVILVGCDMCFTDDGKHHAYMGLTSYKEDAYIKDQSQLMLVPGVDGKPRKTFANFKSFISIFEQFLPSCGRAVINRSGGALIAGCAPDRVVEPTGPLTLPDCPMVDYGLPPLVNKLRRVADGIIAPDDEAAILCGMFFEEWKEKLAEVFATQPMPIESSNCTVCPAPVVADSAFANPL